MNVPADPFCHCPQLRGRIVEPAKSIYRNLDHARLAERMRANGVNDDWRRSDEEREATRRQILVGREGDDVWVFGYGSLIWDPAFHFAELRTGELAGHHRKFCLKTVLGRGSKDRPGLMAGLDHGGRCAGLAFRIAASDVDTETNVIWRREMVFRSYIPQFLPVMTPQGQIEAIAFVVDQHAANYVGDLDFEVTAEMIGTGIGEFGTNLSYVENLVDHFETMGIEDEELSALRDRARAVASENAASL